MRANAMRFVLTLGAALVLGVVLAVPASAQDGTDELTDRDQIVRDAISWRSRATDSVLTAGSPASSHSRREG